MTYSFYSFDGRSAVEERTTEVIEVDRVSTENFLLRIHMKKNRISS